jgi:integrase
MAAATATPQTADARVAIEMEHGVTVYPPRPEPEGAQDKRHRVRWRAAWYEDGERHQCEAVTEERLAVKLDKVIARLAADAPKMLRPGADLIAHYLSPDRHPTRSRWSPKHADTQRRLCKRFVAPVIDSITCQDIRTADMQKAVNAAPTEGEGSRLHRCLSAMVTVGIRDGYLTNPRLREVHWQAGGRPEPEPQANIQGETGQFIDPAEIPADADIAKLGQALAEGPRGGLYELMANTAAYSGLRQGEEFALTIWQITLGDQVIDVDRKVVEVGGKLLTGLPKGCKRRKTIYPDYTPLGYPLAEKIGARIAQVQAEMDAGLNPLGLMFPSPGGKHWWPSNFDRRILAPAYLAAGWRDADGNGQWTWHGLRHVFCVTALFTWHMEAHDVAALAGHASVRTTLDMYIGTTAGVLDRARKAIASHARHGGPARVSPLVRIEGRTGAMQPEGVLRPARQRVHQADTALACRASAMRLRAQRRDVLPNSPASLRSESGRPLSTLAR